MDQAEFRQLAMSEMDAVYRLAHHLANHPQEADDFVQETYLRAFKSGRGFRMTEYGIRPWLFKILHNVVKTRFSKDHRQRQLLEDVQAQHDVPDAGLVEAGGALADLSGLDWETVDERLKRAIDELPLPHRTVFLLCAVEGLRYREIAEVMDVPLGTVMSRLYRARTLLSSQLAKLAAEHGIKREAPSRPTEQRAAPHDATPAPEGE